jgi:hypothetical protein
LTSQLAFEQDRADDAERKTKEACVRFKDANNTRMSLQSEVTRLTEELRLYKDALDQAQKEIFRAQGVIREVEERRREAEQEAAKLRSRLRKINEEKLFEVAREEGRKQGLQEGLAMGKDTGHAYGRNKGYVQGRVTADRALERHFSVSSEEDSRQSKDDSEDTEPPPTTTTPRFRPEVISVISRSSSIEHRDSGISRPRPRPQSRTVQTPPARNAMFSPANAMDEIPHDGWIPRADASLIIRLPPPHELQRRTLGPNSPSPLSGSPSSPLAALPVPLADPLMVPEPRSGTPTYAVAASDSSDSSRPRRVRRRSSAADSMLSTRTSELELLSPPEHTSRNGGLSVIHEAASIREQSTPSSKSMRATVEDHVDEV